MKKTYRIDKDFENSRLDRWFKNKIIRIPQSLLEKNLRKGNIRVNKSKRKSSYKLKVNDTVEIINFNPYKSKKTEKFKYKASSSEISKTSKFIIENNANFIVINKPRGIAVQSGTKSSRNILDILQKTKYFYETKPYTVHRLDKDTSGVLLIAKNREYAQLFTSLFRIRKIHKTYLSVVLGSFKLKEGTFNDDLVYKEEKEIIKLNAISNFKLIDSNNFYSLLELNPITGRKHQLRKQLLKHNFPVLGDSKYRIYDYKKNKKQILMLHAYKIKFKINNQKYEYIATPDSEFSKILKEKNLKNFF